MPMRMVNGKLVNDDGEPVNVESMAVADTPADGVDICEVCGLPNYEYSGRGRHPKYHADCRPVQPSRSRPTGTRSALRNEAALREALTSRYLWLSTIAALRHPAYAESIRQNVSRAVEADIAYAKQSPSFRKALESILTKTAAAELIGVHAAMMMPIVMGEASRRAMKKASRQVGEPGGLRKRDGSTPPNRAPHGDDGGSTPVGQEPSPPFRPTVVTDDDGSADYGPMPGDTEGTPEPETVNAAAMPGMPG